MIAPPVSRQPAATAVPWDTTVTFTMPTYFPMYQPQFQWRFNGNALPGATSSNLVIATVESNNIGNYDVIISNPPFHAQGAADRPDIGRAFIAAAAEALRPGGRLWMVANRHLPYESVLDARFGTVRIVTQTYGFKIIEAVKAGGMRA